MRHRLPQCEGIGIGSLPFTDPRESLDLIKSHLPVFPHWPQQPSLGEKARIIPQFTYPLERLGLIEGEKDKYSFTNGDPDWEKRLTEYYQLYLDIEAGDEDLLEEYYALPEDFFPGFYLMQKERTESIRAIKGQVSGPLTVGLQVKDYRGRDSFYDETLRDVLRKTIALEATWQIKRLQLFQSPVLISIDDPGIYACGSSAYISIRREDVLSSLQYLSSTIQRQGAFAGIHCCAGIDWSLPLQSNIDVLSFDAYGYFHTIIGYTDDINSFFHQGGLLAWGLIPTNENAYHETAQSLLQRLKKDQATLIRRGVHEERVKEQLLLSPSCGCGTLEGDLARRVYSLTEELVNLYHRK